MNSRPTLYVVAGPNGSGKSTLTGAGRFGGAEIIDPDAIASGGASRIEAARAALARQADAIASRRGFAVETTLAGARAFRLMEAARAADYRIELHYIRTDDVSYNIERIGQRVAYGGHHIPREDVERRFARSTENLRRAIGEADAATLYDNTGAAPRVVASIEREEAHVASNAPEWARGAATNAVRDRLSTASAAYQAIDAELGADLPRVLSGDLERRFLAPVWAMLDESVGDPRQPNRTITAAIRMAYGECATRLGIAYERDHGDLRHEAVYRYATYAAERLDRTGGQADAMVEDHRREIRTALGAELYDRFKSGDFTALSSLDCNRRDTLEIGAMLAKAMQSKPAQRTVDIERGRQETRDQTNQNDRSR